MFSRTAAAQLSAVEQGLDRNIDAKHDEAIELLEGVVSINASAVAKLNRLITIY
jgi:hypothetical protein